MFFRTSQQEGKRWGDKWKRDRFVGADPQDVPYLSAWTLQWAKLLRTSRRHWIDLSLGRAMAWTGLCKSPLFIYGIHGPVTKGMRLNSGAGKSVGLELGFGSGLGRGAGLARGDWKVVGARVYDVHGVASSEDAIRWVDHTGDGERDGSWSLHA